MLVEHAEGAPTEVSLQALTLARGLAQGEPVHALLDRQGGREAAAALGAHGVAHGARRRARRARRLRAGRLGAHRLRHWPSGSARPSSSPRHASAATTCSRAPRRALGRAAGRELRRRDAGRPARADARALGRQPARGGAPARRARVLTVAPHAVAIEETPAAAAAVEAFAPELDDADLVVRVRDRVAAGRRRRLAGRRQGRRHRRPRRRLGRGLRRRSRSSPACSAAPSAARAP